MTEVTMDSGNFLLSGKLINKNTTKGASKSRGRVGALTEILESRQMLTAATAHSPVILHAVNATALPSIPHVIAAFEARLVNQVHADLDHVTNARFDALIAKEQTSFATHITKLGGTFTPIDISTLAFEASAPKLTVQAIAANHVSLSWTAVTGATSYTVEVSSGKTATWTTLVTTSTLTASDTNLTGKTVYRFRVTASNGSVSSLPSHVVSIRPATAAAAEQRHNKAIALSLQRFQHSLTTYLEKNAGKSSEPKYQAHVLQLQKAFAKRLATAGVVYEPQSISSVLVGNVGGANDGPVATAVTVSNNEIDLTWPATTGAIVYLVEVSTDGGTTWNPDAYTITNSYDDVGLTSETAFSYRVTATTSSGPTASGATATATTLPDAPSSLVLASDTPTTSGASFTLSWAPVTGATDYHVEYSTDPSQLTLSSAAMIDAGASTSAAIGGLSTGTTYFVSVQALDTTGQQSAPSDIASMLTTPDSPTVTASSPLVSEVDLTWNAIPTATSYTVLKKTSGTWTPVGNNVTGTSFADTHLTADTAYAYSVVANNVTGGGVPSAETDVTTRMNAPTGFTAVASTNSVGVTLTWNLDDATSYVVQRSTDELNWGALNATPTVGSSTVTLTDTTGLQSGGTYYYRVFDVNSAGGGLATTIKSVLIVPATPTLSVASISSSEIDLTWQPVFGASSYLIQRSSPDDSAFATLTTVNQGPGFYADKSALPDTVYYYRVTASNATGSLAASTEQTTSTRLGAVQGLTATPSNTSNGTVALSWTAQSDATSYTILRKTANTQWAADSSTQTVGSGTVTATDTGLADGTTYSYAIVASSTLGAGAQSASVSALTLPGAPTLTAHSASGTEIDLSWTPMPGASSYVLDSSIDTGTTWVLITLPNPSATSFADTGLTGNTAYEFEVTAVNATGSSPVSNTPSATTLLPTPGSFAVTPSTTLDTEIDLAWTAVDNATGYSISRSTPDATHWQPLNTSSLTGSSTSFADTTVIPGTKYYYSIVATSTAEGNSAPAILSGTTLPASPVFTATSVSAGEVDLTWAPVKSATSYVLQKYNVSSSSWAPVTGTITSPYADTSLTPDSLQQYELASVNGTGTGAYSAEVDATTRVSAPANLTAGAVSGSAIRLQWTAVTDAVSYEVDRSTTSTGPWTVLSTLNNPSANTYTDSTGLSPNTHYYYRVNAINPNGASAWSTADKTTLMPSPTGLKAVATTANITVSWSPVTGASDYVLIRSSGSSFVQQTLSARGVLTFTDTAFTPDTTYQYEVGAVGTNTTSAFTAPVSVTTLLGAPTGLAAAPTATGVALSWTPVTDATGYVINRTLGNAKVALTTTGLTGSSSTFLDTTALGNTSYSYTISAVNALGTSLPSSAVAALSNPSQPQALKATANPDGTITLNWTALTGITSYTVQSFDGLNWNSLSPVASTNTLNVTTGLIPDVAYTFRVIANNHSGASIPSASVTATTVQASPSGLAATSPRATEIDLSWTAGVDATGYKLERSTDHNTWTQVVSTTARSTSTTAADTTVTAGTTYYYRISTISAAGTGQPSTALQTVSRPAAVASVGITTPTATSLSLIWATVTGATNYQINIQPHGSSTSTPVASTSSPTFVVNGLNPDTQYGFQIVASNFAGAAAASPAGFATTLLDVVRGVNVTPGAPGSGQVNLAWTALTDATSYIIERSTDNHTFTKLASPLATAGVTFADKTIAANTTYYYEVAAVDSAGQGAFGLSNPILTFPATPALPTTTRVTTTEVDLSWGAITGASQYLVEANNGLTGWQAVGQPTTTTFNATGLAADTSYQFRVTAINTAGPSAASPVLTVSTAPASLETMTAKTASATEIDLAWTGIADAKTYTIRRSTDNSTWTVLAPSPALTKTSVSYADKTVVAGKTYYYELSVTNAAGASAYGPAVSAQTLPAAPAGLAGVPSGSGQITLTWTAATSAVSYLVERSLTGRTWTAAGSVTSTTFIDSGLTKGTAYQYRVTAINATGAGVAAAPVTVTTALPQVTTLTLTATTATDVTLAWTPVTGAAKYKIERSTNNTTWTTLSLTTTGTTRTVDDKTVLAGTTYYYRITALATATSGNSPVSPVKVITTLLAAPALAAPRVISGTEIDLSWTAVSGASGYILQGSATGTSGWTALTTNNAATTTYHHTGLTARTKYFYRLIAVNIAGNSLPGAVVSATTTA